MNVTVEGRSKGRKGLIENSIEEVKEMRKGKIA